MSINEDMKQAIKVIKTLTEENRKLKGLEQQYAIVGMACRFPKGANSLDEFWTKLKQGENLVTEIPESRWQKEDYYSPDLKTPDKMYTQMGAFLDMDVSLFDAEYFRVSPKEALMMDPQQRILLEVVLEALLDAGYDAQSVKEKPVGFFLGQMNVDYLLMLVAAGNTSAYVSSGNALSATAGRVSYTLGLQGPCMAIDTACSSSLVALNSAIQSMREGESEMAIVAGVNLIISPLPSIQMCQARMLSAEGYCKTFDATADGYTRGEGCGVIIIKSLEKAQQDKDRIWAVIRGSAVNQDGASSGLTVPNPNAQEQLIRFALGKAGLQPEDIDYIEAHGTGTSLGDPIEMRALNQVFHDRKNKAEKPLIVSSVKTYLGHLEAVAGVAGIIKTVLSMHHNWIPKHLHLQTLNPAISLESMNAVIPTEGLAWPKSHLPKRAGVSSFGFSGINAHVILEEAPQNYVCEKQPLPPIVYNRKSFWYDFNKKVELFSGKLTTHSFLIAQEYLGNKDCVFNGVVNIKENAYLKDHVVLSQILFPGAAFIDGVLFAAQSLMESNQFEIKDLTIERPLPLSENQNTRLQLIARQENSNYDVAFYSEQGEGEWVRHISAKILTHSPKLSSRGPIAQLLGQCPVILDPILLYQKFASFGLSYGPHFQGIIQLQKGDGCAIAKLRNENDKAGYICYPATLDSALQTISALISATQETASFNEVFLPFQVDCIHYEMQTGAVQYVYVELLDVNEKQMTADVTLLDDLGRVSIKLQGFKLRRTSLKQLQALFSVKKDYYVIPSWHEVAVPEEIEVLENIIIEDLREESDPLAGSIKALQRIQAHAESSETRPLIIVTQGLYSGENPVSGALLGLVKTAIQEYPLMNLKLVDTDNFNDLFTTLSIQEPILALYQNKTFVHRLSTTMRLGELTLPEDGYKLEKSTDNIIENIALTPQSEHELNKDEIEIYIHASGLNFRDVLNALGLYPGHAGDLGLEAAGIVRRIGTAITSLKPGDAVFGIVDIAFRSYGISMDRYLRKIPDGLTFENTAGLPIVYLTAYHGLFYLAKIKKGDKVLIHAATGGVGLAAIQLAKYIGAQIYATASSSKQAYLKDLGIKYIYDSRSLDYSEQILTDTNNLGVDIVLNSLTSDGFINASLKCLKKEGVFIEIGKRNIYTADEMKIARQDVSYHVMALDDLSRNEPDHVSSMLEVIKNLLTQKEILPLPVTVYPIEQVKEAFMTMQRAKHIGKIVVTQPKLLSSINVDANYLITGGLGALGLMLAKWLVQQGAKHIVLVSRSAPTADKQAMIAALNADIQIFSKDMSDDKVVNDLLKTLEKQRPLKGIFHLAGVLDDGVIAEQNGSRFEKVFAAKVSAAWSLHKATKNMDLDYFVLFSSIASSMGSAGQSNYAAANGFLDQLAIYRHKQHLPALSINWGTWASGMAETLVTEHARKGIQAFSEADGFYALSHCLQQSHPVIQAANIKWDKLSVMGVTLPWLKELVGGQKDLMQQGYLVALLENSEKDQREIILKAEVSRLVKETMGLSKSQEISQTQGFFEMGMDSLMAIELRNRLQTALGNQYPINNTVLFEKNNLQALFLYIATDILYDILGIQPPIQVDTQNNDAMEDQNNTSVEKIDAMTLDEIESYMDAENKEEKEVSA